MAKKTVTSKSSPKKPVAPEVASLSEKDKNFLIVGMGASAGGLEAFKEFFSAFPKEPNMAFVIVQHLDPTHKSLMVQLLKSHTDMEVSEVKNNTKVLPNHVYVIPPNKDMAIFNGVLHLMTPTLERGFRKPIDFFLRSLAEDQMEKAIGIILSGTGTEGTLSLKTIKGHGGLSIVQNPKTAKYDGMPRSAIAAGVEDFILDVKDMPKLLLNYSKNRKFKKYEPTTKINTSKELLEKIFILLRTETGCNFSDYKISTVSRRIDKRMALNQIDKLENYITYLQKNRTEVQKLFKELLIGVTSFFRDPSAFEALQKTAINDIIDAKKDGETIRVWVAGCSTGEEAYSIAILFDESIKKQKKDLMVQVFASDMDDVAINFARQGIYPDTIASDISKERFQNYFHVENHTCKIKKEIRDQIIFAEHNLIKDPPFSKQDMVSCRNLLIYLNVEAQRKVSAIFHYALNPKGFLFLGTSESLGENSGLFKVVDRKHKIFRHNNAHQKTIPEIVDLFKEPEIAKSIVTISNHKEHQFNLASMTEKLLVSEYTPAAAVIDEKGDAVYFSGNTGKYLQPSPGEAKLNIVDMAREGLKTDLQAIISKVRKSQKKEYRNNISVKTNGSIQTIDLCIRPLILFNAAKKYYMVTFEDKQYTNETKAVKTKKLPDNDIELHALEQELTATKEFLRSTIEQLEISNEELKSSNEELQSSNEELQSTNEELETSREELQSVNEELVTVNSELQQKIDELALANNDMSNLLASTEIGTIFLDSNLNIKRYTEPMTKIINLIEGDVGRPVSHLSSNLLYDGFIKDVQLVLKNLVPLENTVKSSDGLWYKTRIMPYRTLENVIEGVVITFVDITEEKTLADELSKFKKDYEHLAEMTRTIVFTQDKNLIYTSIANIHADFQFINIIGKKDTDVFTKEDAKKLTSIKESVLKSGKSIRKNLKLSIGGKERIFDMMIRPLLEKDLVAGIACTLMDITELAETEKELAELKKKANGR